MLDLDRYRTLTFDCYGTLIDWETGIVEALRPVLAAHGVELGDDELLSLYGELEAAIESEPYRHYRAVLEEVVRRLGERLGFAPAAAEVAALAESVADWPAFPDTAEALRALQRRYELVVVSNIDDDLFAGSAPRLGVELARVVTAQQVGAYKPSKRVFRFALGAIERRPQEVLHVAQSLYHDVAPARELGIATVWVDRRGAAAGSGATPAATARPDVTVESLAELVELVRRGVGR